MTTRILHLSDPHFGAFDPHVAEAFLSHAKAMRPDITLLSGDLTMRARRGEIAAARAFVENLPTPRLLIPGNHDIPSINHPFDRFFHPFRRYCETFGSELEPELIQGGVHVVSLNSTRAFGFHQDWSEGRVSTPQLTWMRKCFENSPAELRVLMLHHPLLELQIPGRAVVKPLAKLLESMETARVDLVVCGHFHRSQIVAAGLTDQWRSVISQAPTVCSTRLQGEPQGFHEIKMDQSEMEVIHFSFRDGSFQKGACFRFSKSDAGWREQR